jgi:quinol monooxygenase YgiN
MPRTLSPAYDAPPTEKERGVSEVVVVVTLQCKAGREQEMRQTLTGGSAATHEEDGCVVYAVNQGVDDPTRFALVECWASQAHLDAHLALPEVKDLITRIDALADGQPAFAVYAPLAAGDPAKGTLAGRA